MSEKIRQVFIAGVDHPEKFEWDFKMALLKSDNCNAVNVQKYLKINFNFGPAFSRMIRGW